MYSDKLGEFSFKGEMKDYSIFIPKEYFTLHDVSGSLP